MDFLKRLFVGIVGVAAAEIGGLIDEDIAVSGGVVAVLERGEGEGNSCEAWGGESIVRVWTIMVALPSVAAE